VRDAGERGRRASGGHRGESLRIGSRSGTLRPSSADQNSPTPRPADTNAVDSNDILELVADHPLRELDDGERVLVEGEASTLYVLVGGVLEVRHEDVVLARITEPGAVVGEVGMLLDQPAGADVVAVGPSFVRRVDDVDRLVRDAPELMTYLATTLARRLFQVTTYLTDLQAQFADSGTTLGLVPTVLREMLDHPGERYDVGSEREPDSPY
jgi:CRP/FNR family cyclic AMP-dependent transcriptional regulator